MLSLAARVVLVVLVALAAVSPVASFDLREIESLADIITIAILRDSSVRLSDLQIHEMISTLQGLEDTLRPRVQVSGDYRVENLANNPAGLVYSLRGVELDELARTGSGSVTIVQQLGLNNQLRSAFDQTRLGLELASVQKEQAVAALAASVQEYYHGLLNAYHGKELATLALEVAHEKQQIALEKEAQGVVTPLDVLREQNAVLTAANQLQAAEHGLDLTLLALLQLIGLNMDALSMGRAWVDDLASVDGVPLHYWEISLEEALEAGLRNRPEIRMLNKQQQMARLDYAAFQRRRDWTITLSSRYVLDDVVLQASLDSQRMLTGTVFSSDTQYPEVDDADIDLDFDIDWPDDWPDELIDFLEDLQDTSFALPDSVESDVNPWQVNLGVTFMFGDGGAKRAEEQRLEIAVERARIHYTQAKDGMRLEIYHAHQQLEQAWRGYTLGVQLEKEAQDTWDRLERMYALGSITETELREGSLLLGQARTQRLAAQREYQGRQAALALAMGVDPETLVVGVASGVWQQIRGSGGSRR